MQASGRPLCLLAGHEPDGGRVQLAATADSIVDGEAAGEIDAQTATTARTKVLLAEGFLTGARDILADPDVGPVGQHLAQTLIGIADKTLDDALVILK